MLMDRIIGAFTFRKEVYADVEQDQSFTTTAWTIVGVLTFINQVVSTAQPNILRWLIAALVGTALSLVGFAVAAFIIDYVGRTVFYADVTFEEVVRVLGLASVWTVVGILGSLVGNFTVLACLTAPFLLLAGILGIASWFIAVKEALDLEWVQTIVTVVIGFIVWMVFIAITGFILGLLGLGARTAGQLIGA